MQQGLHAVLAAMPDNAGVKGDVRDIRITIYATTVYPYNMHGSLMKTYKGIKNNQAVPCVTMPNEIVEVRIKPRSQTTLEVYFDQWIISMRLHNADSAIKKTSLKFDVQIKAQPKKVMSAILPWNK